MIEGSPPTTPDSARRIRLANRWGLGIGGLVYFLILFDFRLDLTRTALRGGTFSGVFDVQARALLDGRLNVPTGSLGIEGFIEHGKTYEYFLPFPALLRMPIMLITHEFDGRLTLLSMALAWVVLAWACPRLLWSIRTCLRPTAPVSVTEAFAAAVLLAAATGGTTAVYDAGLPWVYHEVYAWECALVIAALYWLLELVRCPSRRTVAWCAALNLATIMTRTTGGAAVCAATLAAAIWMLLGRLPVPRRRLAWATLAAGAVPVVAFIALNTVKFGHPYLFPLQDQIWTQVNAHRREALARNGGTITGLQFLPTTAINYLRPDGIRFTSYFPFITLPAHPAPAYAGAFLDQSYRTGSATAFMPLLFAAGLWSLWVAWRPKQPLRIRAVRFPLIGALLVPAGVLGYGYLAQRYVTEFVPFVIVGGFVGGLDVARRLVRVRRRRKLVPIAVAAAVGAFQLLANAATGYTSAAQTWGGDRLADYVELQHTVTGGATNRLVTQSDRLPARAPTDQLRIIGDCAGLYLSTGDVYSPWAIVEQRGNRARILVGQGALRAGREPLFRISGPQPGTVSVQTDAAQGRLRIRMRVGALTVDGGWLTATPGAEIDVYAQPVADLGLVRISTLPGGLVGWAPFTGWDKNWRAQIGQVQVVPAAGTIGLQVRAGSVLPLALCRRLARSAGLRAGG